MLNELCLGLQADEVAQVSFSFLCKYLILPWLPHFDCFVFCFMQALSGIYAKDVHVRLACLNAIKCIPAVAGHSLPQNLEVGTHIWIALHDPDKVADYLLSLFVIFLINIA